MVLLLLLFLLPFTLIFIYHYIFPTSPSSPPGLPIIGNLHQFDSAELHVFLCKLSKKYGSLMHMKLGYREAVVISSATIAKEVLKTHDLAFSSRPSFIGQKRLSYNALDIAFSPYSDYWREMKKICVLHLFSLRRVKQFHPIREDEVSQMINRISKLASSYQQINLSEIVMSLTSNIICRSAFGLRYDKEGEEKKRFHKLMNEVEAMLAGGSLVADFFPSFGWIIDKLTGKVARLERVFMGLDSFYQELIDKHLHPNRPKSMEGDIIDILLGLMEENSSLVNLTWDHIKAVLMNVLVGGTDTSAVVIIWAMTTLMKDPRVMNKVQQEIREFIGREKCKVDEDDIKQLPYFKTVIKETLRLYTPVPLLVSREIISKCTIDDEYEIKPKTIVIINAWAIARDPKYWKDPEEFYPERFLDCNIDYKGQNFEFIPFGAGRRMCPGMTLGLVVAELALANLLYAFDWELPSGMKKEDIDTEPLPGLVMHKKNHLCLFAKNAQV